MLDNFSYRQIDHTIVILIFNMKYVYYIKFMKTKQWL